MGLYPSYESEFSLILVANVMFNDLTKMVVFETSLYYIHRSIPHIIIGTHRVTNSLREGRANGK